MVLVELPWNPIPKPEDILFRLSVKGYKLILAHPERYKYVDRRMVERLVSRGVLMQIELGSYVGVYGGRAEERAWRYLERGWSHLWPLTSIGPISMSSYPRRLEP